MSQQISPQTFSGTAAENYERYFVPVIPAPLAGDLLGRTPPQAGEYVLDVACGTGFVARLAAQHVGGAGRVVGADPHPGMLEVARSLAAPPGTAIEWLQAPAEDLPLPDESFDLVLCQLGLMFVADRAAAVREMRRVLAPGGRVAINAPGAMPRMFQIMAEATTRHISQDVTRFVGAVFSLHDPDELEGLLTAAGLRDVAVETTTRTLRLPAPADFFWQYVHATPMKAIAGDSGDDRWDKVAADVLAQWQEFVQDDHLVLHLPVLSAIGRA